MKFCRLVFELHFPHNFCHIHIDRHFIKIVKSFSGHPKHRVENFYESILSFIYIEESKNIVLLKFLTYFILKSLGSNRNSLENHSRHSLTFNASVVFLFLGSREFFNLHLTHVYCS